MAWRDAEGSQEVPLGPLHRIVARDPPLGLTLLRGLHDWETARVVSSVWDPGFCLATLRRGGGLIQGPTHPEFWHTHGPTNVPPPPPGGGGGLTPTHPPTHPRTQLRHAIQKTKSFTEVAR